jgi:hypothetical protein
VTGLSQASHRPAGRHRAPGALTGHRWTVTCGNGLRRTARTPCTDLRIRRPGLAAEAKMPPAGALWLRDDRDAARKRLSLMVAWVGLIIPPAIDQGEPSRLCPAGKDRSSGGALRLLVRETRSDRDGWTSGRRSLPGRRPPGTSGEPCPLAGLMAGGPAPGPPAITPSTCSGMPLEAPSTRRSQQVVPPAQAASFAGRPAGRR